MSLSAIHVQQFTAFEDLQVDFSPGINVFVGGNGVGKTHLLKIGYVACAITQTDVAFPKKLLSVFMPSRSDLARLAKGQAEGARWSVTVYRRHAIATVSFELGLTGAGSATTMGRDAWVRPPIQAAYIPVNDVLANAPGFRSLYAHRAVHFEELYDDILVRAYLPPLRKAAPEDREALDLLEEHMGGTVIVNGEEFFLQHSEGDLEFSLLAEGIRKLGLLWLLIRNGSLLPGSVLFWDEPESNLNPQLFGVVIEVLLGLQRRGVQVFLATHDYVVLKELDLRRTPDDDITFQALYRDEDTKEIACNPQESYLDISPNAIFETFDRLYDRDVRRSLEAMEG